MRTTYRQPPNMKGKKFHAFGCGCCWARDVRDEYREQQDRKEMADPEPLETTDFDLKS